MKIFAFALYSFIAQGSSRELERVPFLPGYSWFYSLHYVVALILFIWSFFVIKWYLVIAIFVLTGLTGTRFIRPLFNYFLENEKFDLIYLWILGMIALDCWLLYLYI